MRLDQSESRVKPKSMIGLQACMGMSETGFTYFTRPKYRLLEFILSSANLNAAYKKMNSNTGIRRNNGMSTEDFALSKGVWF